MRISQVKKAIIYMLIIIATAGLAVQIAMNNFLDIKTALYLLVMIASITTCGRIKEKKKKIKK
ncbi:hypothetical protein [uncultured Lactobacillus sp.]|uniref:hypothetical protein n=1 Tax=uncultured Lactobacillus sp. TaxID=153152 RepID=UPI00262D7C10|nr:hypothetical protein [uncultured Lactobacillus sp.]